MWETGRLEKIQRREQNNGTAGDTMPKSLLWELPITDVEYTSQMRVEWELTLNSGQVVNFTESCRQWKETWML